LDDASKRIVDRSALIERGERLLHEKGATWFAERLLNEASGSPKVVFDGIRPVDTIRYILEKVPQAQVLFIKTPELKRRARYNRVNSPSSMPYDQVANAAVEATARGVEPLAIEISNDGSLEEFYESIQKAIEPKRSRWRAGSPDPG